MRYQDMYWNLFKQSGDPEAYMQYSRFDRNLRCEQAGMPEGNDRSPRGHGGSPAS